MAGKHRLKGHRRVQQTSRHRAIEVVVPAPSLPTS